MSGDVDRDDQGSQRGSSSSLTTNQRGGSDSSHSSHESQLPQNVVQKATHPSMTPQEKAWWAMSFDELYQHAYSKGFGKRKHQSRKDGRVRIVKWLCAKEGITPYVAPSIAPTTPATATVRRTVRPTGAISHPEAILRTSDPDLQRQIDAAEARYRTWTHADLTALAMQRSYQLLKDSHGKMPSRSVAALANWLAGWDVLKSEREKKWWLGDGIDLVNMAKAMGYQGPPNAKKYDVIVWLRSTPEDAELDVAGEVAEPTPNKNSNPAKRKAGEEAQRVSKRPAKGSRRSNGGYNGWGVKIL